MRQTPPEVRPFGRLTIPAETVEILPNGLTFHRLSGGSQPVCRLSLMYPGGMSELGNDLESRLMLSMLSEGCERYDTETLADILDFNGIRLGTACHTHYSSLTISALNHRVPEVLPVVGAMLQAPSFPKERLANARLRSIARIETEKQDITSVADKAFGTLVMGATHPLAADLSKEQVEAMSRARLMELYCRCACPAQMHAFLSGLLDDRLVDTVRSFLGSLPATGAGMDLSILPFAPSEPGTRINEPRPDSMQSAVLTGLTASGREHPDYIPLRLTVMALGGYFGSRLMTNIREEKGLTYGISAALIGSQEGAYVKIGARCDKSFTDTVLQEIAAEMRSLATNPPQGRELERLRLYAATSLAEILDTPDSILGYYSTSLLVGTPADYFDRQQAAVKALDSDTISAMATRYLNPDKLLTAIVGA